MYVLSIVVCPFVLFLSAIVLSILLRYTVYDCPFGIFKLLLNKIIIRKLVSFENMHFIFLTKTMFIKLEVNQKVTLMKNMLNNLEFTHKSWIHNGYKINFYNTTG